jgi:hypothetical protein
MRPVELQPGERVLWTGKPKRFPFFRPEDKIFVPASLVWCAVLGWAVSRNLTDDASPVVLAVFGLFAVLGLWVLFGRLILRRLALKGAEYTVTSERAVVTTTVLGFRREKSTGYRELEPPTVVGEVDGVGTVLFGDRSYFELILAAFRGRARTQPKRPLELRHVDLPAQVRDLVSAAMAGKLKR